MTVLTIDSDIMEDGGCGGGLESRDDDNSNGGEGVGEGDNGQRSIGIRKMAMGEGEERNGVEERFGVRIKF